MNLPILISDSYLAIWKTFQFEKCFLKSPVSLSYIRKNIIFRVLSKYYCTTVLLNCINITKLKKRTSLLFFLFYFMRPPWSLSNNGKKIDTLFDAREYQCHRTYNETKRGFAGRWVHMAGRCASIVFWRRESLSFAWR